MFAQPVDPVRGFEHTHGHLTQLAFEVGRLVRVAPVGGDDPAVGQRLRVCLEALSDELFGHFAREEEGLFPFVRAHVPAKAELVDRLTLGHDAICGAVVRLAHAAGASAGGVRALLPTLYNRFETAYATHSREEADLFADLNATLQASQRAELVELLRGI